MLIQIKFNLLIFSKLKIFYFRKSIFLFFNFKQLEKTMIVMNVMLVSVRLLAFFSSFKKREKFI